VLNDARNNEMIVELIDVINLNCLHLNALDIFLMLVIDYARVYRVLFFISIEVQIETFLTTLRAFSTLAS
jgi:hypothetical protein